MKKTIAPRAAQAKAVAAVLLIVDCLIGVSAAPIDFGAQLLIDGPDPGGPVDVKTADLDGDGDLDVLWAALNANQIVWYENVDAAGTFAGQTVISTDVDLPIFVSAADVDGDGDLDVLSASRNDDKIAWYENLDGTGIFGPQQVITTLVDEPESIATADVDGDGDLDVLSASRIDDKIAWYENLDGLGSFGPQQVISTLAIEATSVVATDVDGDGDVDVLSAEGIGDRIGWYENLDGSGTFSALKVIDSAADGANFVNTADVDGDGDMDVLSTAVVANTVSWYENLDGAGTFGAGQVISTAVRSPTSVTTADVDGDGDLDALSISLNDDKVAWYENQDGKGAFGTQQVISTATNLPASLTTGDLDGDGDVDVLTSAVRDNRIALHENLDGLGTFDTLPQIVNVAEAFSVATADVDADGDVDVLAALSAAAGIVWYENLDAAGNFGAQQAITSLARGARSVAAADVDGDGDMDALSASSSDNKIAWYENLDGLGAFGAQQVISTAADGANWVATADLDGDGDLDVLSASFNDDKIAWYENLDGTGGFSGQQVITTTTINAASVTTADVDGDGDLDVLSASFGDGKVAWYENLDGAGMFGTEQVISAVADGAFAVTTSDVDGDGDVDVLSASANDNKIAWYENLDGSGAFGAERVISTTVAGAISVMAADVDGDGDADVLAAAAFGNTVAWYENLDGSGAFGAEQVITTRLDMPRAVTAADADGDGSLDVFSASVNDKKLAWYRSDLERDFGDAPTSDQSGLVADYSTVQAHNGARHEIDSLYLGMAIDADTDGQPSAAATGDDIDSTQNDEDGVTFSGLIIGSAAAECAVTVSQANVGHVNAFVDFNHDGDFSDSTEQIVIDELIDLTSETISFSIPSGALEGPTFARVRLSTAGGDGPTGQAKDGEVEDYQVTLALPTLSITDISQAEDSGDVSLNVSLSAVVSHDVNFEFSTSDGSATTVDSDYTAVQSGVGTISAGTTSTNVVVPVMADTTDEIDETLTVNLSNPNGATLADGSANVTILNDDTPPDVSLAIDGGSSTISEDGGSVTITVSLSEVSGKDVVLLASLSGTATEGTDYTISGIDSAAQRVTIPAGSPAASITASILDDIVHETDETLVVTLESADNASLGSPIEVNVNITDNDPAPTPTPTPAPTATPAPAPTATPATTPTPAPTATPAPTPTPTSAPGSTAEPSPNPTAPITPEPTPTSTPVVTPTPTPTPADVETVPGTPIQDGTVQPGSKGIALMTFGVKNPANETALVSRFKIRLVSDDDYSVIDEVRLVADANGNGQADVGELIIGRLAEVPVNGILLFDRDQRLRIDSSNTKYFVLVVDFK